MAYIIGFGFVWFAWIIWKIRLFSGVQGHAIILAESNEFVDLAKLIIIVQGSAYGESLCNTENKTVWSLAESW
jgi:hypothetical protein